jgi:hypothetical protein
MVRKAMYLTGEQMRDVERRAKLERKSKSQVIRELIERGLRQPAAQKLE